MIRFYSKRKIYFCVSGFVFLLGIIAIFINGVHLDIEFKGGSILRYQYTGTVNVDQADKVAEATLNRLSSSQETKENATGRTYLVINLAGNEGLSSADQIKLDAALKKAFPNAKLNLYDSSVVEPFMGKQFRQNGIIAIVLSFFLVCLYVWYSFRKIGGLSAGVMAIIALVHDIIVVFCVFVIFRIPINENFVAAALSIIGFSVNDTIVIYDRIRENMLMNNKKLSVEEIVDKSINQSLSRSINTNVCVFFSMVIVCIFAAVFQLSSIQSFALPMTFGTISGCYSTVCIAGPLWVMWKNHKAKALAKAK